MKNSKGIEWIALATGTFDDDKIQLIEAMPEGDTLIVIWVKLLILAGKLNSGGVIMMTNGRPYNDEMLATIFHRPLTVVRLALSTFEAFGMIEYIDDIMSLPNWEKYQQIDGMDKIREQTRIRVARHRAKQKQLVDDVTLHVTLRNGDVTHHNNNNNIHNTNNKYMCSEDAAEAAEPPRELSADDTDSDISEPVIDEEVSTKPKVSQKAIATEFEELWKLYPRKRGKDRALKAYLKARKDGTTYEQVERGILNYTSYIERKRVDEQYIKHGSTFFTAHAWEDEYGTSTSSDKDRIADEEAELIASLL